MKILLIFLILTSCYHLSTSQVITDNGNTITFGNGSNNGEPQTFDNIPEALVDSNPMILGLINYGGQVVIGNIADSRILDDSYSNTGNYTKIYAVSANSGDTINVTADVSLQVGYYNNVHSIFTVHYDPAINYLKLLSYSYEWQEYSLRNPSGINISYDPAQDLYELRPFSGFNAALSYRNDQGQPGTLSGQDFLQKFANWTSLNTSDIYANQTLQFAFNAALRGLRSNYYSLGLLPYDYGQLNVTVIHTIDTYGEPYDGDYIRFDFEFATQNQSGRAVTVVNCPIYSYYYPPYYPYYPPYYPYANQDPLVYSADGSIQSTATSESVGAGASAPPTTGMTGTAPTTDVIMPDAATAGTVDTSVANSTVEEAPASSSNSTSEAAPQNGSTNVTAASENGMSANGSPIITDNNDGYATYYYNYNCLYGQLDYYWFIEFRSSV